MDIGPRGGRGERLVERLTYREWHVAGLVCVGLFSLLSLMRAEGVGHV